MVKIPKRVENPKGYSVDTTNIKEGESFLKDENGLEKKYSTFKELMEKYKAEINNVIVTYKGFPKEGVEFKDLTPALIDPYFLNGTIVHLTMAIDKAFKGKNFDFVISPEARGFYFGPTLASFISAGFVPVRKAGKVPFENRHQLVTFGSESEYGTSDLQINSSWISKMKEVFLQSRKDKLIHKFKCENAGLLNYITEQNLQKVEEMFANPYDLEFEEVLNLTSTIDEKTKEFLSTNFNSSKNVLNDEVKKLNPFDASLLIVDDVLATGKTALSIYSAFEALGYSDISYCSIVELEQLKGRKLLEDNNIPVCSLV